MSASRPIPIVMPPMPSRHTKGASQSTVVQTVIYEGWLLKKRRKKMQGFARRYFSLNSSGQLSYSFEPGKPPRDSISLSHAAVSTSIGRKDIHIDSQNATFHLKCLSSEDFGKWMMAFRRFIATDGRKSSIGWSTPRVAHISRSVAVVDDMGVTIAELESALASWQNEDLISKHRHSKKPEKEKYKDKDKEKKHHKDNAKDASGSAIFSVFKRGSHHNESTQSDALSDTSQHSPQHRVHDALEALKTQHETLIKSLHTLSNIDAGTTPSTARASPLPSTAEEEEVDFSGRSSQDMYASSRFSSPFTRKSTRNSMASSYSESTNEWFDAPDGGEEYILDEDEPTPGDERNEFEGGLTATTSGTSIGGSSDADEDEDDEEEETVNTELLASDEDNGPADLVEKSKHVVRRNSLPSGPVGDDGSLFAVLKKNVGKDLSSVAFPVSFNEPITLLQNAAEQLEYHDLLRQAVETTDPVERMCYVAAFAVSGYAHTRHRSGRKSFNPLLAETFEDVRMNFIAEKVEHHPFVMAYHAEGNGWELDATSSGKTKFWGKSLEIIPLGTTYLKIGDDYFSWNKPSSFMRNLMVGTKYLEHSGKLTIDNKRTKARCVLEFKPNGYFGSSNQVVGTVFSSSGKVQTHLEGKWDDQITQALESSHLKVLWRIAPFPRLAHEYYGFTSFGITLNEITEDIEDKLPPTDSRFRPDVRALEEGDIDEAEAQKVRLEEGQRERRKKGQTRDPQWFELVGDEWVYKGGYWEARANGWRDVNVDALW